MKKISELVEKVQDGVMKNASQLKIPKDGIGMEFLVEGRQVVLVVDKELPTTFLISRVSELLVKLESDIKDRM
jgi:hypothetical protein